MLDRKYALGWIAITLIAAGCADAVPAAAESAPLPGGTPQTRGRVERDVPYVPTPEPIVRRMLDMARVTSDDLVYDLGSGDGRIVIAAARERGARGVGIDIDPERIREAIENAERAGVSHKVRFIEGDLFDADLRPATAVTLYLLTSVNLRLRPKLLEELRPGTPVVSHDFAMGEWEPDEHVESDRSEVFLWIVPAKVEGTWRWDPGNGRRRSVTIRQSFQKIEGTAGGVSPLRDAVIRGEEIAFTIVEIVDGRAVAHRYQGRVNGNAIEGVVRIDGGATRRWTARRES
ncbi:MAG TPA: class I SAM-dependent methyltransferase [Thermoanaerobaculia bacterium]|nr:class I SAM-dependent methyltransferase [Thermoanaerobaculia bacterium]